MIIEIEITEEDAACIWANNWGEKDGRSVRDIVQHLVSVEAQEFRVNFPDSVKSSVDLFRQAHVQEPMTPAFPKLNQPQVEATEPREKHPWYPKNSFHRFAKPVCGTACKVCKGFALEIEETRERPCPACYPGPVATCLDSADSTNKRTQPTP